MLPDSSLFYDELNCLWNEALPQIDDPVLIDVLDPALLKYIDQNLNGQPHCGVWIPDSNSVKIKAENT